MNLLMNFLACRLGKAFALTAALFAAAPIALGANGFDLSDSLVPELDIEFGGPPRDGIPSIDAPLFIVASKVDFLKPDDLVLGLTHFGFSRAYPIAILNWHEVVNDWIGGEPVAITYCPLCGTGMAFVPEAENYQLTFGVSGLLYNSDVLLYDRETETLWSQLMKRAIAGPLRGARLRMLPLTQTTWRTWLHDHPNSQVLSTDTGYERDYGADPYGDYAQQGGLLASVTAVSRRYHPKERVLGIEVNGRFKAYPFVELFRSGAETIVDPVAGADLVIRFDREDLTARAFDLDGRPLPAVIAYWFAWYAFHPDTAVFEAGADE